MHVTIAQFSPTISCQHYDEDSVFEWGESYFPDGVTEHKGEDMDEDIQSIKDWFGEAIVSSGREQDGPDPLYSKKVVWVDIDFTKLKPLFSRYWHRFRENLDRIGEFTLDQFVAGPSFMESAIQELKESYSFDWLYILDENGMATPISDWLRYEQRDIKIAKESNVRRFYICATYDGDQ